MSTTSEYTVSQRRIVDALQPLLGSETIALYEMHDRSLQKLVHFARQSPLPGCQRVASGLALAQALLTEEMAARSVFSSPAKVGEFLTLHFAGRPYESFGVLYLDAQHALLAFEDLFRGTLTQTSVYPREVLQRGLHHHAAAVILTHNHPSGSCDPSRADELLTQTLRTALAMVDIRVVDHVIVAGSRTLSFAERGLL